MSDYEYQIEPRPEHLGGGWRLRLLEFGEEVGGGIYEPGDDGYGEALAEGEDWLATRPVSNDPEPVSKRAGSQHQHRP